MAKSELPQLLLVDSRRSHVHLNTPREVLSNHHHHHPPQTPTVPLGEERQGERVGREGRREIEREKKSKPRAISSLK